MKKFFLILILSIFFILTSLITILSTIGVETNKFNNLILKKINQTNNNISLELTTIKFKLDIKEISLFLDTNSPLINYRGSKIPVESIKGFLVSHNFLINGILVKSAEATLYAFTLKDSRTSTLL